MGNEMKYVSVSIDEIQRLVSAKDKASRIRLEKLGKVELSGWVRTNRNSGSIGFISLNDGTSFNNIQLVYNAGKVGDYKAAARLRTGASIRIRGDFVLTPAGRQPFEINLDSVELIGDAAEDYPLQKKHHTVEFLREIAHLRPRSNLFGAIYRVRNALSKAIHDFFQKEGFIYVHTPIITGNDAEGAGQTFLVETKDKKEGSFYGKPAVLTVTGQLHVEAFALAYRKVYTFGPTFRAERSNTPRHASEFWMVEPEIAFADLDDDMRLIERCLKYCMRRVLRDCPEELAFLERFLDPSLRATIRDAASRRFRRMSYTRAINKLKEAVRNGHEFDNPDIRWGMELQSEHERYLTEEVAKGPLFITDYPSDLKAFYMRENDDGRTVAAVDLLFPRVGELVGGSQREERYDVLKKKMEKAGNLKELGWYLDLRKYGGCPHAGFGIGFDRFLMFLTGAANIRDVQPFPRTADPLKY